MSYELVKKFRFESAHRLAAGYVGKCRNIHGHSWNGEMCIKSPVLDKYDMAMDFALMKEIIKPVEDELDHALLLSAEDEELVNYCKERDLKVVVFNANPTSEVIARHLFNVFAEAMNKNPKVKMATLVSVTIEETCTSACTFSNRI